MGNDHVSIYDHCREIREKDIQIENFRRNEYFYIIALRLSGKKETLEGKAEKLIEKHGFLRALKLSRTMEEKCISKKQK